MGHFTGKPLITVQPIEVDDPTILRDIAIGVGILPEHAECAFEVTVDMDVFRKWLKAPHSEPWFESEFFNTLARLQSVDVITFTCEVTTVEAWSDFPDNGGVLQ